MKALAAFLAATGTVFSLASPALADRLKVPSEAYPTIQSAVDAAVDGDVIEVALGGYAEDVVISGKTNLTLRGRSRRGLIGGAYLSTGSPLTITGGAGIVIRNLTVTDGHISTAPCIVATGVVGLRVERVSIQGGFGNVGLSTAGCTGVVVSKCIFEVHGKEPILDQGSSAVVVDNCRFYWPGADIISLSPGATPATGSPLAVLTRNRAQAPVWAEGAGFRVVGNGAVIDRNRIATGGGAGIQVNGSGAVVSRNQVRSGATGIELTGANFTVDRNRVLTAFGNGIRLDGNSSTVIGNRISNVHEIGLYILSTSVTVVGNRAVDSDVLDLADASAEGVNTYLRNRFGTTAFEYVP